MSILSSFLKFKQCSIPAIDINSGAVSLLQLTKYKHHYRIENYARIELPLQAIEGHVIKDYDAVMASLHALLEKSRLSAKSAVIAIPDVCSLNKIISINPCLTKSDIHELVAIEVEKYIQCALRDICFDFQVIGASRSNPDMLDLQIIASRTDFIQQRIALLKQVGFQVKIIDIQSIAIERTLKFLLSSSKKITALLDLSSTIACFFVLHDTTIIFSYEERISGECSDNGLRLFILAYLKRMLALYSTQHFSLPIERIILSGDIILKKDLYSYIQEQLVIACSVANPCKNMSSQSAIHHQIIMQDSPLLMTLCGLALRTCT